MSEVAVKVFVRVRPLLGKELLESDEVCLHVVSEDQLVLGLDRPFRFDRVFKQDTSQSIVYQDSVRPLINSCLDGYNVTVLAYGQTGSGKSYTMGSEDALGALTSEARGIIPRALEELFECIQSRRKDGFDFKLCVSYLEIYKEELRDLLCSVSISGGEGHQELHIREGNHGYTVVIGCTEQEVEDGEEALSWLGAGNAGRITGETQMNQRSSRSHAIFTIHIRQSRRMGLALMEGSTPSISELAQQGGVSSKFHFVDLAGSERVGRTGNRGERFKESVHINGGLLALGNVISALSDPRRRGSHIPYRESKITRLLKDSLGGNAQTVMITSLSPAASNFAENLSSLKYSKRAKKIRNCPIVNQNLEVSKLEKMKGEIMQLREELVRAKMETNLIHPPPLPPAVQRNNRVESREGVVTTTTTSQGSRHSEDKGAERREEELAAKLILSEHQLASYSKSLLMVKKKLETLIGEREGGGAGRGEGSVTPKEGEGVIRECLSVLCALADGEGRVCDDAPPSLGGDRLSPFTPSGTTDARTISTLRSELEATNSNLEACRRDLGACHKELEACHKDLISDEQAFAEKMEEITELQSTCRTLTREKERAESMWMAAQENEARLQNQVEELVDALTVQEGEELAANVGGASEKAVHSVDEVGVAVVGPNGSETSVNISIDSLSDGGVVSSKPHPAPLSEEECQFEATRSLMQGKDFTEEAVLGSLRVLTQCLLEKQNSLPKSRSINLGATYTVPPNAPPVVGDRGLVSDSTATAPGGRPATPLERSEKEPCFSVGVAGGGWTGLEFDRVGGARSGVKSEMELLNESALDSRQQLKHTEKKLGQVHDELRCLTIKIKLKEELIHELGKNTRSALKQSQAYVKKIHVLEEESALLYQELQNVVQKNTEESIQNQDSDRALREYKKKLSLTEKKLAALQQKQKDTTRLASYGVQNEQRVKELESGIGRLRNQQESLRRKLKHQAEKKSRVESDLQKYQHRIKSLQMKSEQQTKVLRVKTEEAAAAQRKLRVMTGRRQVTNSNNIQIEEQDLMAKRKWLEEEQEKVLSERKAINALEKELLERERIIKEKELLVVERDSLEVKKLRCSQRAAQDLVRVSDRIKLVDKSLDECDEEEEVRKKEKRRKDFEKLTLEKQKLTQEYEGLLDRMEEGKGSLLSSKDQNTLLVLNERIQMLDAAIQFKNNTISSKKTAIFSSGLVDTSHTHTSNNRTHSPLKEKLEVLEHRELCDLLENYFEKVVQLHLAEEEGRRGLRELEVRLEEEGEARVRTEGVLTQVRLEAERRITKQQVVHNKQIQFLMEKIAEAETAETQDSSEAAINKLKALEKDLYYYKKTSRALKKKLNSLTSPHEGLSSIKINEDSVNSAPEYDGGERRSDKRKKKVRNEFKSRSEICGLDRLEMDFGSAESLLASSRQGEGRTEGVVNTGMLPVATTISHQQQQQRKQFIKKHKNELRQLSASDLVGRQKAFHQ